MVGLVWTLLVCVVLELFAIMVLRDAVHHNMDACRHNNRSIRMLGEAHNVLVRRLRALEEHR